MSIKRIVVQEDYNAGKLPEMWVDIYNAVATAKFSAREDAEEYLSQTLKFNTVKRLRKFRIIELTQAVILERDVCLE